MVGQSGIDLNIEPVLAWAGQTNDRLGLLTDAITGNKKGVRWLYIFSPDWEILDSKEIIKAVLAWAGQNKARWALLKMR